MPVSGAAIKRLVGSCCHQRMPIFLFAETKGAKLFDWEKFIVIVILQSKLTPKYIGAVTCNLYGNYTASIIPTQGTNVQGYSSTRGVTNALK